MNSTSRSLLLVGLAQILALAIPAYADIIGTFETGTTSTHGRSGVGSTTIRDTYSISGTLGSVDWTNAQNFQFNLGTNLGEYSYTYLPAAAVNAFDITLDFNANSQDFVNFATPSVKFDGVVRGSVSSFFASGSSGALRLFLRIVPTQSFSFSDISIEGSFGDPAVGSGTFTLVNSKFEGYTQISSANYPDFSVVSFAATSAIPEPSTWGLIIGSAALTMVMIRRKIRSTGIKTKSV